MSRFLIVDDDSTFSSILARTVSRAGHEVEEVNDPGQVLARARQFSPECISLDLKMGRASGLQLIAPLLVIVPDARIVVLTGYSSVSTAVQAIKLGACDYLCKPVLADDLLAAFNNNGAQPGLPIGPRVSPDRLEWEHIQKVLNDYDGNISATARALGMHRRTLQRKLHKRPVRR